MQEQVKDQFSMTDLKILSLTRNNFISVKLIPLKGGA